MKRCPLRACQQRIWPWQRKQKGGLLLFHRSFARAFSDRLSAILHPTRPQRRKILRSVAMSGPAAMFSAAAAKVCWKCRDREAHNWPDHVRIINFNEPLPGTRVIRK